MGLYSRVIFPRFMTMAMSSGQMKKIRSQVLPNASGNILEIGFGTGLNLEFYPPEVKTITTVDPNPGMSTLAERNIAASNMEVRRELARAEALPMADESFDTVVCTWTLCSIPNVEGALGEIRRVLKPEGHFVFVEHGLADDPKVQRWQNRITPWWKHIGDGCHLNRNMKELIQDCRFRFAEIDTFYMPKSPRWAGYMYKGVATKG